MRRRHLGRLAILAATAVGLVGAIAPQPANAQVMYQGDDRVVHSSNGRQFYICDGESDGHRAFVQYYQTGHDARYYSDWTGGNGTCSPWRDTSGGGVLTNLRAGERDADWNPAYYGPWHGYPVAGN